MSSSHNLCKQIEPRSGPTMRLAFSGYNPFDTLIVFLKEYFENVDILKKTSEDKTHKNFPGGEELCVIS